jgi:uncharacterized cupredoxin-like copper-binding protein
MAPRLLLIAALLLVLLAAGCAGQSAQPSGPPTFATTSPTASPIIQPTGTPGLAATPSAATAKPSAAASPLVIEVTLTDALRIEPAAMSVPAGRPITFRVTNAGALEHEFYLGDAAAQTEHEAEMQAGGGEMTHDGPMGIGVASGTTEELTFTFPAAGDWFAGCHVTNHYSGGMRARITITP